MSQVNSRLVMGLAFIASLGGLLFGYDTAVISGAVSAIDHNFIMPRGLPEASQASASGNSPAIGARSGVVARYAARELSVPASTLAAISGASCLSASRLRRRDWASEAAPSCRLDAGGPTIGQDRVYAGTGVRAPN